MEGTWTFLNIIPKDEEGGLLCLLLKSGRRDPMPISRHENPSPPMIMGSWSTNVLGCKYKRILYTLNGYTYLQSILISCECIPKFYLQWVTLIGPWQERDTPKYKASIWYKLSNMVLWTCFPLAQLNSSLRST